MNWPHEWSSWQPIGIEKDPIEEHELVIDTSNSKGVTGKREEAGREREKHSYTEQSH